MKKENTTIVISHYNENLAWVNKLENFFSDIKIYTKCKPESKYNVPINVGNEASSFLLYIIEHYDNLKDYTIFLHGHEFSWHHNGSIVDLLLNIKFEKIDFYNMNNQIMGSISESPYLKDIEIWYKNYLEKELGPIIQYNDWTKGYMACAQFLVHKSLIQSKTKNFYENLYNWILTTTLPSSLSSRYLEWCWHLIWNQVPKK